MKKAVWNGIVLAESDQTIIVEGNHYFPIESVKREYLQYSPTHPVTSPPSRYRLAMSSRPDQDGHVDHYPWLFDHDLPGGFSYFYFRDRV